MKLTYRHVIIFFLLIALSIGFGFAYNGIATAIETKNHPIDQRYAADIEAYAEEFGIPQNILWAMACTESQFVSNLTSSDGRIGLMQLSPTRFDDIQQRIFKGEPLDHGMLYHPSTNLRFGAALLSDLYQRYGVWETVYAAYRVGEETVDAWLADPNMISDQGRLQNIPNAEVVDYIDQMCDTAALYQRLYFSES